MELLLNILLKLGCTLTQSMTGKVETSAHNLIDVVIYETGNETDSYDNSTGAPSLIQVRDIIGWTINEKSLGLICNLVDCYILIV
jgi:hypothetical protein